MSSSVENRQKRQAAARRRLAGGEKPQTESSGVGGVRSGRGVAAAQGEQLLFLTDEQIRCGIEMMFFSYRAFTRDADDILKDHGYGRAHHRALHFIATRPDLSIAELLEVLGVTKQSLNRVLRELINEGMVEQRVGETDRRQRRLRLTPTGVALEKQLAEAQRARVRRAYREAGPEAVAGFREVLERLLDPEARDRIAGFVACGSE